MATGPSAKLTPRRQLFLVIHATYTMLTLAKKRAKGPMKKAMPQFHPTFP